MNPTTIQEHIKVDPASLDTLVRSLSLTEDSVVEYNNRDYGIFYDHTNSEKIAISHPSSLYTSDIYVWRDVPKLLKKLVLFHEVLEADLAFGQGLEFDDAHRIATVLEDAYARQTLHDFDYRRYRRMREEVAVINDAFQAFDDQKESKGRYQRLREHFLKEHSVVPQRSNNGF